MGLGPPGGAATGFEPATLVRVMIFSFSAQRSHKGSSAAPPISKRARGVRIGSGALIWSSPAAARFRTFAEQMWFGTEAKGLKTLLGSLYANELLLSPNFQNLEAGSGKFGE